LENNTLGFGGLQHVEIPQNRQSFVWKSLEQNTLDLEKLGETQGGPPLFRHLGERRDCGNARLHGRRCEFIDGLSRGGLDCFGFASQ
jgi:hypothetical protein